MALFKPRYKPHRCCFCNRYGGTVPFRWKTRFFITDSGYFHPKCFELYTYGTKIVELPPK